MVPNTVNTDAEIDKVSFFVCGQCPPPPPTSGYGAPSPSMAMAHRAQMNIWLPTHQHNPWFVPEVMVI